MGGLCSIYRPVSHHAGMGAHEFQHTPTKLVNNIQEQDASPPIADTMPSYADQKANSYNLASELGEISKNRRTKGAPPKGTVLDGANRNFVDKEDYARQRAEIKAREDALSWDFICKRDASDLEQKADETLQALRMYDEQQVYAKTKEQEGYGGQKHPRFMGDHFLYNVDLISETKLFKVAERMPKGAHLHIHFNANLPPDFLIDMAMNQDRMFITSDFPLVPFVPSDPSDPFGEEKDQPGSLVPVDENRVQRRSLVPVGNNKDQPWYYHNFNRSRLRFSILSEVDEAKEKKGHKTCNIFSSDYPVADDTEKTGRPPMRFKDFCDQFREHYKKGCDVRKWLIDKLVFNEEEAHGWLQTPEGAWKRFNARTQMMKGLFNYETAYRKYTRKCLEEFVRDKIQYAEIRPTFMDENHLLDESGEVYKGRYRSKPADRKGDTENDNSLGVGIKVIMDIIIEECEAFQRTHRYFTGIKVIYCTPRSFNHDKMRKALNECFLLKKDKNYGPWIAGFDLVGEESKGYPLKEFIPELLDFKKRCRASHFDIPFLFHCGETLAVGNDTDGNLYDALLLGAKRIGHGFALPRHPYVMEQMKKNNICLELCPISNEILGLTPRVNGHAMYSLLANNVHCSVNTDNGTPFKSTLSHDFYQVFAGKADMTLHGWKQLALWSIEHSCLEDDEREKLLANWNKLWVDFCNWIVRDHGQFVKWAEEKRAQSRAGI
ncbi:hypothetical protein GE09DRAFT_738753 [Coniochaeta sp. 2T2.1]|nr:hypothetical protein GE09DRAFT_738753 [Coniochaeta sp. 2T2.1]